MKMIEIWLKITCLFINGNDFFLKLLRVMQIPFYPMKCRYYSVQGTSFFLFFHTRELCSVRCKKCKHTRQDNRVGSQLQPELGYMHPPFLKYATKVKLSTNAGLLVRVCLYEWFLFVHNLSITNKNWLWFSYV
jgi:hypothetical protein